MLLLHPLALSGAAWAPLVAGLESDVDVIAPDARGHGGTAWDGEPFGLEDLADDVTALLDELELERVDLVGMSMGGSTAALLAALHPGRVRTLVVADATAWYGEQAPEVWAERAAKAAGTPRADQVPFQRDRWFTKAFRDEQPERVQAVVDVFLGTDSRAHAAASVAMGGLDARDRLPDVVAPTLCLTGEEDYATPPEMGQYLADHVRRGRFELLPGLRHLSLIEDPSQAARLLAHARPTHQESTR